MTISAVQRTEVPSTIDDLLRLMAKHGASDLHLKPTRTPLLRIDGKLVPLGAEPHDLSLSGIVIEPNVGGGTARELVFRSVELFAREVAPALR